ncbi:TetR/AcrR family transcriptional regulator [Acidocella sp.]|uniref:TetR/AcrR family transcriptional regulator n=1 Tax=Acidocella sp. TaxID=50710 RepID=UPI0026094CEC|nr:TetR/AcrR family transcriptional regulator [Acidocella sp.]
MAGEAQPSTKYVTPLRQAHRELTRSRIRSAARDIFYERHYDSATMDEIALAAGLRRQTLYLHYKDKAEILTDIIADWLPKAKGFMATLPGPKPSFPQLRQWIAEVTQFVARERAPLSIILEVRRTSKAHTLMIENLTTELLAGLGEHNPPFRETAREHASPLLHAKAVLLLRELIYACDLYLDDPSRDYASALLEATAKDFYNYLSEDGWVSSSAGA